MFNDIAKRFVGGVRARSEFWVNTSTSLAMAGAKAPFFRSMLPRVEDLLQISVLIHMHTEGSHEHT